MDLNDTSDLKASTLVEMECLRSRVPFHCLITGPTNCGKTKYVTDQLRGPFRHVFDVIILICPTYSKNATWSGFAHNDSRFFVIEPDSCQNDSIEEALNICSELFHGNNKYQVLVILDDCAVSHDVKRRTSKLIDLAFSGRHTLLSVWVLTQQMTSIALPFRENLGCVVAFHNPEKDSTDLFFRKFGAGLLDAKKEILEVLRNEPYSRLCISLMHPSDSYVEIAAG